MGCFGLGGRWVMMLAGLLVVGGGCAGTMGNSAGEGPILVSSFEVAADYQTVSDRIMQRATERYVFASDKTQRGNVTMFELPGEKEAVLRLQRPDQHVSEASQYRVQAIIRGIDSARCSVEIYCGTEDDYAEGRQWGLWARTPLESRVPSQWAYAHVVRPKVDGAS
jgi:hypothetical protein